MADEEVAIFRTADRICVEAGGRRHGGCRGLLLRREGWSVNAKRVYWLYREMELQLRNKTPKRLVKAELRDDCRPATRSNET